MTDKPQKSNKSNEEDNILESQLIDEDASLPSPDNKEELHDQIATLSQALKEAQEKVDSHWERLLRREAEFQNLQKRSQQDIENARKFAIERFGQEVLAVADSIEQGLNYAQNGQATAEHLTEGLKLTYSVLLNTLDKEGIKLIEPQIGEPFNPSFHEAISMQATNEMEPNKIIAVVQKGYMLHTRLLRPARVVVSQALK